MADLYSNTDADLDLIQSKLGFMRMFGGRILLNGDSRMDQYMINSLQIPWVPGGAAHTKRTHFAAWLEILSGGALTVGGNFGISGQTSTQYLTRLDDMLAVPAAILAFCGVHNDIFNAVANGDTIDTIWARVSGAIAKVIRKGRICVWFTESGGSALNSAQIDMVHEFNNRLFELMERTPGLLVFDYASLVWDQASTSTTAISFKTNYSFDQLHLTSYGHYFVGKALAGFLNAFLFAAPDFSAVANYVPSATRRGLLTNQLMLTNTTSGLPTGFSGALATGFHTASGGTGRTGTGTVVGSIVAAPDGKGNAQKLVVSDVTAGDVVNFGQACSIANLAAGDWTDYGAKMVINSGANNLKQASLYCAPSNEPNAITSAYNNTSGETTDPYSLPTDLNGRTQTHRTVSYQMIAGFTYLIWQTRIIFQKTIAGQALDITLWNPWGRKRSGA